MKEFFVNDNNAKVMYALSLGKFLSSEADLGALSITIDVLDAEADKLRHGSPSVAELREMLDKYDSAFKALFNVMVDNMEPMHNSRFAELETYYPELVGFTYQVAFDGNKDVPIIKVHNIKKMEESA